MKSKILVYVVVGMLVANYMPLLWNEEPVFYRTASANYIVNENTVIWENQYGKLEVYPHTSHELIRQTQYCNLTVYDTLADIPIDVAFRFNFSLQHADIWHQKSVEGTYRIDNVSSYTIISEPSHVDYGDIPSDHYIQANISRQFNRNYTLYNVTGYTVISSTPPSVDWGDIPSNHYINVTVDSLTQYSEEDRDRFHNLTENTWYTICGFDSYQQIDSTTTIFNYSYYYNTTVYCGFDSYQQIDSDSYQMTYHYLDWVSVADKFNHISYNGKEYYYISNVTFPANVTQHFKWEYDVPVGSSGKWDLIAKLHSDTIQEAFDSERYIMLDPWWDSNWQYYKVCNINTNGYSGYYQMKINVTYNSGGDVDCEGHCQADFDDIRFVDIDNSTVLPHWKEEYVSGQYAIFWVNVSADAMSDGKILMYYGNPSATDASNGDNTFIFFDDFTTDTSSEYTQDSGTWEWDTTNGYLKTETIIDRALIYHSSFSMTTGMMIMTKVKTDATQTDSLGSVFAFQDTDNFYHARLRQSYFLQFWKWVSGTTIKVLETTQTFDINTWYKLDAAWLSSSEVKLFVDGVEKADITSGLEAWTSGKIGLRRYMPETEGGTAYFDYLIVRKYSYPEPSWSSFGSEVDNTGVTPPYPFNATVISSTQINLTWTKGNNADTTYIERNTVVSWNRGEGTLIYNGTGTGYSDTGLDANTTYYYQAWSYNATDNTYSSINWTGLDFDGANDNVRVPDDDSLNLTSSFTIDMALYVEDTPADSKFDAIISKMTDANTGWGVALYSEDGTNWELHICVDDHNQSVGTASIPTNTWVYPTVVFNASTHTMHVYINGNEIYSYNESNTPSANTADVVIGECSYVGNDKTFDGKIDYIRIYNKALTEQQVKYNFYWKDSDCVEDGLVSWWKFDENTGTTTADSWGNNNGTLEDGTAWATGTKEIFNSAVADLSSIVVCNITLMSPSNGSVAPLNPVLKVQINSTDGDIITVTFYNATDDSVIGTDTVEGNGTANVTWSGLTRGNTYSWYVVANDSTDTTTSPTWSFTVNVLPDVVYISPADNAVNVSLYSDIIFNVSDNDSGGSFTVIGMYKTGEWVKIVNDTTKDEWTAFTSLLINNSSVPYINETFASQSWINTYNTTYHVCLIILDYDTGSPSEDECYYWNFTTVAISNAAPYINEAYPDGITNLAPNPQLRVNVSDVDGDLMNITWKWNNSGTWQVFAQNSSVGNGTYYAYNANFSEFNTTYEWMVSIYDGYSYTNATYWFTTEVDDPPYVEAINPANGSTGIEYNPVLQGGISNPEEYQTFNVTFYWNDGGVWKQFAYLEKNYTTSPLFTFSVQNDNNFSALNTTYYWKIVIQDDSNVVTYVYHFTTADMPFNIGGESPSNGATDVELNPTLQVVISRNTVSLPKEYFVNVTWKWNDSGVWKQFDFTQVNLTGHTSETINSTNANFSDYGTTYEWGVFCYDGTYWYNKTYTFTTIGNSLPGICIVSPANGSTDVTLNSSISAYVYNLETNETVTVIFLWNNSGTWEAFSNHTDITVEEYPGTLVTANSSIATEYNTTYEWGINVTDAYGNTVFRTYTFTTVGNNPPVITLVSPANNSATNNTSVVLSVNVTDTENDTMNVTFYWGNGTAIDTKQTAGGIINVTVSNLSTGNYTWYVTVNDTYHNVTSPLWHFSISTNHAPTIILTHPNNGTGAWTSPVTLMAFVTDADNDNCNVYFYAKASFEASYRLVGSVAATGTSTGIQVQIAFNAFDGTTYTWYAVAKDPHNATATSAVWSFYTEGSSPLIESFEDDTPGFVNTSNPTAIWYTPHTYGIFNNTAWSIVNDTAYSDNQSLRGTNYDNGWGSPEKFIMALNESVNLSSLSFYMYMKPIAGEDNGFTIAVCDSSLPISAPTGLDVFNSAIIVFAQYNNTLYYMNGTDTVAIYNSALYSFAQWKLLFLDDTVRLVYNGTTIGEYEKIQDTYPKYIVFMAGIIDSEDFYANIYIDDVAVSYTAAPGMNIIDNETAEMMTFPAVTALVDNYTTLNASSNFLILYNDYGTIDGTTGYVKVVVPFIQNITNDEMIAVNDGDMHVYAKIAEDDNSTWHDCGSTQDRYVIISDSDWDYSWNRGEHMYIMLSITEPAGFPTGTQDAPGVYDSKQGTSGTWYVYCDSDIIAYDEFNATITIESPTNTPPTIVGVYPENNSTDIHLDSWMTVTIDDPDFWQRHTIWFYWANGTLIDVVRNVNNAAYIYPTLQPATTYEWYVVVNDTVVNVTSDTYTFTTTSTFRIGSAPLLFDPYPSADETNVSIPTTLSIKVYDKDSDYVVVTFYDETGNVLGVCNVTFADVREPKTASITLYTSAATEYSWYVIANDSTNETRYPTSGVLTFTTVNMQPPSIILYVRNASDTTEKIYNATIECVEKEISTTTDALGTGVLSFNYVDIGQTYHFIVTHSDYRKYEFTYEILPGSHTKYIKLTPKSATPTQPENTQDIFTMWNNQFSSSTKIILAFIIIAIIALFGAAIASTEVGIVLSVFGVIGFTVIGWLPWWITFIIIIITAFIMMKILGVLLPTGGEGEK